MKVTQDNIMQAIRDAQEVRYSHGRNNGKGGVTTADIIDRLLADVAYLDSDIYKIVKREVRTLLGQMVKERTLGVMPYAYENWYTVRSS